MLHDRPKHKCKPKCQDLVPGETASRTAKTRRRKKLTTEHAKGEHTCLMGNSSSQIQRSASKSVMFKVNRVNSGGVGRDANGYSLESRVCKDRGSFTKSGGYERFVVVVVVTVFVSTHSASSNCSRAGRRAIKFSSSHLRETCWLLERSTSAVF